MPLAFSPSCLISSSVHVRPCCAPHAMRMRAHRASTNIPHSPDSRKTWLEHHRCPLQISINSWVLRSRVYQWAPPVWGVGRYLRASAAKAKMRVGGNVAALVGDLAQNSHKSAKKDAVLQRFRPVVVLSAWRAASRWSATVSGRPSNRPHYLALSRGRHPWPGAW